MTVRHTQTTFVGGICSDGKNCTVENCINNAKITANVVIGKLNIGAIAGRDADLSILSCTNNGSITELSQ